MFEVFAWVCIDPKTEIESLCAVLSADGLTFQAITSSKETTQMMKPYFEELAYASGKRFKLVKLGSQATLDVIYPNDPNRAGFCLSEEDKEKIWERIQKRLYEANISI